MAQVSIFGPFVFLIFVNYHSLLLDIENYLIMFADDNTYLCYELTMEHCRVKMQNMINKFNSWYPSNKLCFSSKKTVFPAPCRQKKTPIVGVSQVSVRRPLHLTKIIGASLSTRLEISKNKQEKAKKEYQEQVLNKENASKYQKLLRIERRFLVLAARMKRIKCLHGDSDYRVS